jgi:hypothetical protein
MNGLPFTYSPSVNGRVNLSAPPSSGGPGFLAADASVGTGDSSSALGNGFNADSFPGFGYQKTSEKVFEKDMLRGNWSTNQLSDAFFSRKNVTAIQNLIRKEVYTKSQPKGYVIDDQSVDELKIIMRAMYLQYAKNLPHDIPGQVEELNRRVADWSVPHIISAVDHYYYYLKDIETLPVPLAQPVHISRAGTRSKPLDPFF